MAAYRLRDVAAGHDRLALYVARDRKKRWPSRRAFASAASIGLATVDRIELGAEQDYQDRVKGRVEATLGWTDGSFDRVLAGGRPSYVRDPDLAELTRLWPDLPRATRVRLLRIARDAHTRGR